MCGAMSYLLTKNLGDRRACYCFQRICPSAKRRRNAAQIFGHASLEWKTVWLLRFISREAQNIENQYFTAGFDGSNVYKRDPVQQYAKSAILLPDAVKTIPQIWSTFPAVYGIRGSGDLIVRSKLGPCTANGGYGDHSDTPWPSSW